MKFLTFRNYLITAIIAIFVLTFFAKQYVFFPFDLYITLLIQKINMPILENLLLFISWLGNGPQAIMSLIIFAIALIIYGLRKESLMLIVSTIGAVTISEVLKIIVSRPRPDASLIHQVEKFFRDDSFPSGHVLFFIGFYGFLMFLAYVKIKKRQLRNLFAGFFFLLILLIGISRIYLGSHWFSDTLASYLIGSIWLYVVVLIFKKIKVKSINDK